MGSIPKVKTHAHTASIGADCHAQKKQVCEDSEAMLPERALCRQLLAQHATETVRARTAFFPLCYARPP
jgi:hypothetical protein